ncbi:MAG: protein-L-isoaspartate(D-aspartate) O-methyltransferase [Candidatus Omnitrophica bacterium]|nr:protein-L-isoaspartate(D-aspartate) O-methyltransferase [Candidatus Omnitrophota bacterium]
MDFAEARSAMVEGQLLPRGIRSGLVIDAFKSVPRHDFVLPKYLDDAYSDYPLPIGSGQAISQPYMVALMTQCLALKGGERVLEVGTGSGYQTAILSRIVKEVYSVERFASLVTVAEARMKRLGYANFTIKVGDGTMGWEEHAPYDGIVVTAGAPGIPSDLLKQLKDGGRLVIPLGGEFSQVLTVAEKRGADIETTEICKCVFVPLVGKEGWSERA